MAGLSNSQFATLFKSETGCAPKRFFIRLQMLQACSLFMAQSVRVKEVALALGYKDQFYFSRLFKLVTGIAPAIIVGRWSARGSRRRPVMAARLRKRTAAVKALL